MENKYADVIIDISHEALDRVFQYKVPFSLYDEIKPGTRVIVPFGKGNRQTEGYVIAVGNPPTYDENKIKSILRVSEGSMTVESQLIETAHFLRNQYGSSMIQALKTVMPVKRQEKAKLSTVVTLQLPEEEARYLCEEWKRKHNVAKVRLMLRLLEEKTISKEEAIKECKVPLKDLRKLEEQGILTMTSRVVFRNPYPELRKKDTILPLNEEQQTAVDIFVSNLDQGIAKTYLLYGVTGSGKTEVYLSMIDAVLSQGKQAIVLVPEISLTYQTVRRFYERFGNRIVVMHSRMSKGEKSDSCEQIRLGYADVIIGARSALFAPCDNLGLVIIDEEHDGAYKSDGSPKYHARETAIYRASLAGASVVLGSATPSIESYYRASTGEYQLLQLVHRAGHGRLPEVSVVDLREEFKSGNRSMFSLELQEDIRERLERKEQMVLFLNRRGYAGFVSCRSCGTAIKCPHCDVSLTYHRNGSLRCHYCGYEVPYQKICPVCHSPHIATFGLGTERVEAALYQEFPGIRVLRMDNDTTRKKNAHEEILKAFGRGEADVLLGTQMIVKGHDYPNVTLVGILAADLSLHGQNYRCGENTFQLLCQAAGRAGRGDKPGKVVIQTYSPDHYAIESAAKQSYESFYEQEYAFRRIMAYPPCSHLLVILVQSMDESLSILTIQRLQKMIEQSQQGAELPVQILNPGVAALAKLKDVYRQVIYLKHTDVQVLLDLKGRLEPVLEKHPLFAGIHISFDLDPMSHY